MKDLKSLRAEEWRVNLRSQMKAKERTALTRVVMPEMDPAERIKYQDREVNQGLTEEMALNEAKRCLDCGNPTCIEGCPVGINIPTFVKNIERGEFKLAAKTLKEQSPLPAVCGRVCPQEKQCEANCFYTKKMGKDSVAIGYLERFAADYERENCTPDAVEIEPNGIKVAAIGAGPASIAFADVMVKRGYDVTVFEALHEVGGVLKYGIPEFRLPNSIVEKELDNLKLMGVKFITNTIIGRTFTFAQLQEQGFKGFFIGSGAGLPRFMNIPGENLNGVLSANEYLTRVNLMEGYREDSETPVLKGKNIAIIGGGNTAMDAVRTAKRLGAERAMIVYRRSFDEMPARVEELHHAKEEGVEFLNLRNPIEYGADSDGRVSSMTLQVMELGEADPSGRRKPVEVEGVTEKVDIDVAIVAIGVSPNPLIPQALPQLEVSKWGTVIVNDSLESCIDGVFAGGDIVRGGATVIQAMGDGKQAALSMDREIKNI